MIEIIRTDGKAERLILENIRRRGEAAGKDIAAAVERILADVRENGDAAVLEYGERFDGVRPARYELTRDDIERGAADCPKELYDALSRAARNIRAYHLRQLRESFIDTRPDGSFVGQRVRGLSRVGLYVPGGTAAYPSSVLMNAVPAKLAGVKELVIATPPMKNGRANPDILAAAQIAGADRIFLAGGAQAVAALAYGTEKIPRVDKIVGPGNIYVATAKKFVFGLVDIDMIAGPSEILVIADKTADPAFAAADLLSQAEHDVLAGCVLLTDSMELALAVRDEIVRQTGALARREIIAQSLKNYGLILVCGSLGEAFALANEIAPEHLEVMTENPAEAIGRLDNAGSVFLGPWSPEPLGDYYAGPNHVLPTGGTARFFSPLSVDSFIKKSSFIYYTKEAFEKAAADIVTIAGAEGLTAHANSVKIRSGGKD